MIDASISSPSGFSVVRRINRPGSVLQRAISEHRVSLHLSRSTRSVCSESGRSYVRIRGDIDITPADEPLGYVCNEDSTWLELRIPPPLLQRVADESRLPSARVRLGARHLVRDASLSHLALAIESGPPTDTPSERRYLDTLGAALALRLLSRPEPVSESAPASAMIQRVTAFIESNLDAALSLEQLASVAGISSSHLQREFRAELGTSPHRYIAVRRVERARELLLQRSLPASEVALVAGFSHQSHMARWMRRVLGQTPGELVRDR